MNRTLSLITQLLLQLHKPTTIRSSIESVTNQSFAGPRRTMTRPLHQAVAARRSGPVFAKSLERTVLTRQPCPRPKAKAEPDCHRVLYKMPITNNQIVKERQKECLAGTPLAACWAEAELVSSYRCASNSATDHRRLRLTGSVARSQIYRLLKNLSKGRL